MIHTQVGAIDPDAPFVLIYDKHTHDSLLIFAGDTGDVMLRVEVSNRMYAVLGALLAAAGLAMLT